MGGDYDDEECKEEPDGVNEALDDDFM